MGRPLAILSALLWACAHLPNVQDAQAIMRTCAEICATGKTRSIELAGVDCGCAEVAQ